jgi:branched-chain amino acid transport system substrate-binding protein
MILWSWLGLALCSAWAGNEAVYHLYLDADFTGSRASSVAIEQGIRTALDEVDYRIGGHAVLLVRQDHRGNSRRSRVHLEQAVADSKTLAVFCGLHSPPVLSNLARIHEAQMLLLDPWAAAESITRYSMDTNWVFRLSLDDAKVGRYLVDYAVMKRGLRRPTLVLEDTGWGRSNEKNMVQALREYGISPTSVEWFNWNLQEFGARIRLRRILETGSDSIFLVANTREGVVWARELGAQAEQDRIPIISHWGITGGGFVEEVGLETLSKLDVSFVQPNLSVIHAPSIRARSVFKRAEKLFGDAIAAPVGWQAPAGFLHGYDLTRLLIAAGEQASLSGVGSRDREEVRKALESLEQPVVGLIKEYVRPFGPMQEVGLDGHEALRPSDYCMGTFNQSGRIVDEQK